MQDDFFYPPPSLNWNKPLKIFASAGCTSEEHFESCYDVIEMLFQIKHSVDMKLLKLEEKVLNARNFYNKNIVDNERHVTLQLIEENMRKFLMCVVYFFF